jgi:hypothetical protein
MLEQAKNEINFKVCKASTGRTLFSRFRENYARGVLDRRRRLPAICAECEQIALLTLAKEWREMAAEQSEPPNKPRRRRSTRITGRAAH